MDALFLFLIWWFIPAGEQLAQISGSIYDAQSGEALSRVSVRLNESGGQTKTDHEGKFTISGIRPGRYHLVISSLGYRSLGKQVELKANERVTLDFGISQEVTEQKREVERAVSPLAGDLTVTTGIAITPLRTADDGRWNQESRLGPTAGLEYRFFKGFFAEANYVNTNTRLGDYSINLWTMTRASVDGGYMPTKRLGKYELYAKGAIGAMTLVSGKALDLASAGLDDRLEWVVGAGVRRNLLNHLSIGVEYEGRIIRNPDFSDHTWHPQMNLLSEPKLTLTYRFARHQR